MSAALLELRGVTVHLGGVARVRDLTLAVGPGEVVALRGDSGCGKTTALRAAARLVPVSAGTVRHRCRRPATMFQDPRLLPWSSVEDNTVFPLGRRARPAETRRAEDLLDRLGLREVRRSRPQALSGGMRRRVALARALIVDADLLLADEPFAHLDPGWAGAVAELLRERAAAGAAVLIAAHETDVVDRLADRVHVLRAPGR